LDETAQCSGGWWTRQAAEAATGFKKRIRSAGSPIYAPFAQDERRKTKLARWTLQIAQALGKGPISVGMASKYPSASPEPLGPEKCEQLRRVIENFRLRVVGN